ncbi:SusC/RagA family TonB-linked outer membrane protein [Striga asiatica]|uniref:SusC/RagA family TonB-linked outer membrane protein n=1 Tax=Striga asiatica TaxID=4170 RepID=A0A5A7PS72_STRAF|nr:SusC/RagA family TonB-linked outer membrane protein [Striga asiatica]
MNPSNRPIVLVKPINESAHAIIPELDHATVKTRQDPWPLAMETQSFHSIALRLKLLLAVDILSTQNLGNSALALNSDSILIYPSFVLLIGLAPSGQDLPPFVHAWKPRWTSSSQMKEGLDGILERGARTSSSTPSLGLLGFGLDRILERGANKLFLIKVD